jgi:hypothetical protein
MGLHFPFYANQVIIVIKLDFSAFLFHFQISILFCMFWGICGITSPSCRLVSCLVILGSMVVHVVLGDNFS